MARATHVRSHVRALLMACAVSPGLLTAIPAYAQEATGTDGASADPQAEIVIYGQRENGVLAVVEDELGEADIAGYGVDTVGDLLREIGADLGDDPEGPVVLINGELATGFEEIEDLPAEALSRVQLLPRDAAPAFGQRAGRRVVNIVVKRNHKQLTLNGESSFATAGEGRSSSASGTVTRVSNGNRTNLNVRIRDVAGLLEADRGVLSRTAGLPYDLIGNIVPSPTNAAEIDPTLSAIAGHPVSVAAVPVGTANPTLAQFAAGADNPRVSNVGAYRSLIADQRGYSLNGSLSRRLAAKTRLSATLRGDLTHSERLSNAPAVLLTVPAGSPYSPFGRDVSVARYLPLGLEQRRDAWSIDAGTVLNHGFADWSLSVSANYAHRDDNNRSDGATDTAALQAGVLAGAINPFAPLPAELLRILRIDRSLSKSDRASTEAVLSGPLAQLPAGSLRGTFRLGGSVDRLRGHSIYSGVRTDDRLGREELNGQANLEIPLSQPDPDGGSSLGALSVNLLAGFRQASIVGTLFNRGYGFAWTPSPLVALRGSLNHEERAPSIRLLSEPVEVTQGVRFYDVLRDETVDVTLITGGNPALPNEKREELSLGATLTPHPQARRNLTLEYTRTRIRNAVSNLPQLSQIVQDAFADRFVRDQSGLLAVVDGRPVTLSRDTQELLRFALNMSGEFGEPLDLASARRLGQSSAPPASEEDSEPVQAGPSRRAWRYNLSLSHNWSLANERLIRPRIPIIDLLRGGAIGYGGGHPRHQLQANFGVSGRGTGIQLTGRWRDSTVLRAGTTAAPSDLRFASRATVNVRIFADVGTVLPEQAWASGTRLTLSVSNLFDSQQRVRDAAGNTPLRYQPYLLDPLGRTIGFSLRKVF
jgi:iron complex outermembrane receptor protein